MPKVTESILRFRGDDQLTPKMEKLYESIEKIGSAAERSSEKLSGMMETSATGARGGKRISQGSPRSPHAPDRTGIDTVTGRGGVFGNKPFFGWRGTGGAATALGAAGRAPSMAAGVVGGATSGGGISSLASMMGQAGGGMMGAFGGFGAVLGLPMLLAGAGLGLSHMVSKPAETYWRSSGLLAQRLGRGYVDSMRDFGHKQGIDAAESIHWMGQLERSGAQAAFKPMSGLRGMGVGPEAAFPLFEAMTRAGGVRGRKEPEYQKLANMFKEMSKDMHSVPEYLEQLVGMTNIMGERLGDLGEQGSK